MKTMKRNNSLMYAMMSIMAIIAMIFTSCGHKVSGENESSGDSDKVSSEFIGKWESQINPSQRVVLDIEENGKYCLKIFQRNERYDAIYKGNVVDLNENTIKLPSTSYARDFNSNRLDSDPSISFVNVETVFYFRSDGALAKSESGLNNPYGYLHKVN